MQKIFTFVRKAEAISPNEPVKIPPSRNARRNSGQPAELTTTAATAPKKTTVLTTAIPTARRPLPPIASPPRIFERRSPPSGDYLRIGALPPSQVASRRLSVPSRDIAFSALFTQGTSELPFWKIIPKCSLVPRVGSRPTTVLFGTWTAVM
jgi:hypothetical protein